MPLASTDLPDTLARLEDLLDAVGEGDMSLSELDGYLCGILASPQPIGRAEWWPPAWLAGERVAILQGERAELAALIDARFATIREELAGGVYAPLFEVDDETGAIAWEIWLAGFEQAMQLRFDAWDSVLRHPYQDVLGEASSRLATALLLAQPGFGPDDTAGDEDWAEYDAAQAATPENLAIAAMLFYQAHQRGR